MKRSSAGPGPVVYAVVLAVLAAYFVWLLLQMAGNEKGGLELLGYLAIGIGAATVVPIVLVAALGWIERRLDARQERSEAKAKPHPQGAPLRHAGPHHA